MSDRSSLDRTIAERLARLAGTPPTAIEGLTEAVRLGRRHRVRRLRVGIATAVLLLVFVPLGAVAVGRPLLRPHPYPPASSANALRGGFSATLTSTPAGTNGLAGRWDLNFHDDGTLEVSAPPGFSGIVTGFHYQSAGNEVRVDLFTQDLCADLPVGTYTWALVGTGVRFTEVNDACTARASLLTGRTWTGSGAE
jgi:hypothetical protein